MKSLISYCTQSSSLNSESNNFAPIMMSISGLLKNKTIDFIVHKNVKNYPGFHFIKVKQIMEEAVTRKFVHQDSSSVTSLCGNMPYNSLVFISCFQQAMLTCYKNGQSNGKKRAYFEWSVLK